MKGSNHNGRNRGILFLLLVLGVIITYLLVTLVLICPKSEGKVETLQNSLDSRSTILTIHNDDLILSSSIQQPGASPLTPRILLVNQSNSEDAYKEVVQQRRQFENTVKSCLGSYCMTEEFSGSSIERYGFLSPDSLHLSFFQQILPQWREKVLESEGRQYLVTSHVPAYGYGRNHGFTKIIRIVDNIVYQAFRISLQRFNNQTNNEVDVESADFLTVYEIHLRQLIRWNCRLNHVSAHTALLTVFFEDVIKRPFHELQRIFSFIQKKKFDNAHVTALIEEKTNLFNQIRAEQSYLSRKKFGFPITLLTLAGKIIENEMKISRGLTSWPCKSFKDIEKQFQSILTEKHLPITRYYDLSADCSDPFVKCSVPYDKNEQK